MSRDREQAPQQVEAASQRSAAASVPASEGLAPSGLPRAVLQRKIARRIQRRAAEAPRAEVESSGADLGKLKGNYSGDGASTGWTDTNPAGTSTRLPYTQDGGWNAQQILSRLGQVDQIEGTDSDGVRCVQAVALSSHILGGPGDTASYLGTTVLRMIYEGARMKNGQPQFQAPSPRKVAAGQVLATVSSNILNRVATFGDLSWAQEALHDIFVPKDNEGTPANKIMDVVTNSGTGMVGDYQSNQSATSEGRRVDTLSAFATEVDALKDGEQIIATQMIQWTGVPGPPAGHQVILYRNGGKTWLYDPQREDAKTLPVGQGGQGLEALFERNQDKRKWIVVAGRKNAPAP